MFSLKHFLTRRPLCAVMLCMAFMSATMGQEPGQNSLPGQPQDDDVLRINSNVVQTDVMVFDSKGRFVEGLQRDQFELSVDGKPQSISFFERVLAGSIDEEMQLAAARGRTRAASVEPIDKSRERGRAIVFFVDDAHLSSSSLQRTRQLLQHFIDDEMSPTDQVMIVSSSGQLGFLQQFTESKEMLRVALARLQYQSRYRLDTVMRQMTVFEAQAIERNDNDVIARKVNEAMADYPFTRAQALAALRVRVEQQVRATARQVIRQAGIIDAAVLATLENVARVAAGRPGRKLVFFISDGFVVDKQISDLQDKLQQATQAAGRAGIVIYAMDARGLFAFTDASLGSKSTMAYMDMAVAEARASQEVLRTLAADTGGRAILNNNDLEMGITKALRETSAYYLLAWQPEGGGQEKPTFQHMEVRVKGRPDLNVIARRGVLTSSRQPTTKAARSAEVKSPARTPQAELNTALNSASIRRGIHVSLYPAFTNDAERGAALKLSVQLADNVFRKDAAGDQPITELDLAYVVFNSEGKAIESSGRELTWPLAAKDEASARRRNLVTEFSLPLKPGLYQIRLAARDKRSGRLGSASQWIEIPEFAPQRLSLSSLLISEQKIEETQEKDAPPSSQAVALKIDRTFARNSRLLFQTYVYNAARANAGEPQVMMQVSVFHHNKLIVNAPAHALSTSGIQDLSRIPYAAAIPLKAMSPGVYTLQVTATDRSTNKSATQTINFMVD